MPVSPLHPIRILFIDHYEMVRAGLRLLIESQPGFTVIGEATERNAALTLATREQPDVILLDLDLGDSSGLDFLPELRTAAPQARVLVLTALRDPEAHRRAVRLGAVGLLLKEKAPEVLLRAIEKVHTGEAWIDRSMVANVLDQLTSRNGAQLNSDKRKIATLTAREREVALLVVQGFKNRQIAQHLFISETTVRHHLTAVFAKLDVTDRLELVIYAYQHGLAKTPA
jgi:two-component system nitrate/nitrite response regulator NarL